MANRVLYLLDWDLEYYLSNLNNVKNSLIVDFSDSTFIRIKFNNEYISNIEFFEKIKYKNLNMFWINFKLIYNLLLKYNIFNKINKDDINLSIYKLYKNYNDIIISSDLSLLIEIQSVDDPMNPLYYQSYIDEWYKEWYLEINEDFLLKYKKKLVF